ncbi:MAG TPA: helix-turn-helix transcriptional regulator [Actinophytocola sp.]|uniref:helix-turn-helix domain-containing protein n=1 Tax=Actinophytocola sp. TaxID=1872138 RepID=UPI002DDD32A6|nr:helix-turn-helix transcriptional regulator [Actinophytocola sp.]HEV2781958.1 helix-turn-helix transcriptional regulator [Actinophytocola sp.]
MNGNRKPPFLRRRLGNRLRAMRDSAGMSLEEAAPRLDLTRSSLHRIESGATRASVHVIRSMMDLYDCYEDDLLDQAREAVKPRWFHRYPSVNMGYIDVETEACLVREFSGFYVPGLLQTESYIRALFDRSPLSRTTKVREDQVTVRLIRQRRLIDEDYPLELVAIVDEAALRREVGGAEVMRGQLEHLIMSAELPTVTLQVLPMRDGAHSAMVGGFTLLSFPEDYNPELLYVEHVGGALHIEDEPTLQTARLVFDRLRTQALGPADSVTLIERVLAEFDDR